MGSGTVKRVHNAVHLRPWEPRLTLSAWTWTYPTLTPDRPGQTLATGPEQPKIREQRSSFAAPYPSHPGSWSPLSPGHCFLLPGPAGDVQRAAGWVRVLGMVYPGSNGTGLAGHPGHYYQGVPPPPTLYYIIFFSVPMLTDLACLPVVVPPRPCRAAGTAPPLAAAVLDAVSSDNVNNNIILYSVRN